MMYLEVRNRHQSTHYKSDCGAIILVVILVELEAKMKNSQRSKWLDQYNIYCSLKILTVAKQTNDKYPYLK